MRIRNRLWIEAPIFVPKVRLLPFEDLLFLHRWCFSDSELLGLWKASKLSLGGDLTAEVTFFMDEKAHRRRDLACLLGQSGWLRVACGRTSSNRESGFVLYSAFNTVGEPLELAQIVPYFDFVKSHSPLEKIPSRELNRLQLDISRHAELSLCKLKQEILTNRKQELSTIEEAYGVHTLEAEKRLRSLRETLMGWNGSAEGKQMARDEQQQLRKQLLQIQESEANAVRLAFAPNPGVNISIETMFTLAWQVERKNDKVEQKNRR
jgi:hypothetical protein